MLILLKILIKAGNREPCLYITPWPTDESPACILHRGLQTRALPVYCTLAYRPSPACLLHLGLQTRALPVYFTLAYRREPCLYIAPWHTLRNGLSAYKMTCNLTNVRMSSIHATFQYPWCTFLHKYATFICIKTQARSVDSLYETHTQRTSF